MPEMNNLETGKICFANLAHSFRDFSLLLWGRSCGTQVYIVPAGKQAEDRRPQGERQPPCSAHMQSVALNLIQEKVKNLNSPVSKEVARTLDTRSHPRKRNILITS